MVVEKFRMASVHGPDIPRVRPGVGIRLATCALISGTLMFMVPAGGGSAAGTSCPTPTPAAVSSIAMTVEDRTALFDAVWGAIDERHLDPDHGGIDWSAVRTEFAPRIAAASTEGEVDAILTEMVARLGDGQAEYRVPEPADPTVGPAGVGILYDRIPTDDAMGMRVFYVMPGGPAEHAGIHDRDLIVSVDGDACPRPSITRGEPGTSVDLVVRSPGGETRTVKIEREVTRPFVTARTRMLRESGDDRIGYLRMPRLGEPGDGHEVVVGLSHLLVDGALRALVLDLRGAGGSDSGAINAVAAQFLSGPVARSETRDGAQDWVIPEGELLPRLRDTELVVLIDDMTSGAPEALAGILRGTGRATTVGTSTTGRMNLSEGIILPHDRVLVLTTWRDVLADGGPVVPVPADIEVPGDWLAQPETEDSGIAAALGTFGAYSIVPGPSDFQLIPLACNGHACADPTPKAG